jgi:hypothetical protein
MVTPMLVLILENACKPECKIINDKQYTENIEIKQQY